MIESSTSPEDDIYIRSLSFAFLYIGYFKHIFSYRAISLFLIFSFRFKVSVNENFSTLLDFVFFGFLA